MEFKEEVHSDDGSYVLVDDFSSARDLSDGYSYDFLSSDLSDILVLTEEEGSNNTTDNEDNTSTLYSPNDDSEFEDSTKSDFSEEEEEEEEEGEEFSGMDFLDFKEMSERRRFLAMAYQKLLKEIKIKDLAKTHILHYLSVKSLARCQVVSKEWDKWISTPLFAHTQSQFFSQTSGFFQEEDGDIQFISLDNFSYGVPCPSLNFLPKAVSIKSSCNGLLLCQASNDHNQYYVCNPANQEFIKLPKPGYHHVKEANLVLAFQPSSLNFEPHYQVILPFSVYGEEPIVNFDIYDSKTRTWRASDEICVGLDVIDVKSDGVFVSGVVYWEMTGGKLLAFDLNNKIYSVQTLPEGGSLTKVHGELCYVKGHFRHSSKTCVLDVYNGGLMSLNNSISFGVPFDDDVEDGDVVDCRVVENSCDDVVAVVLEKSEGQNCLFVYHVKDRKVEGPLFLGSFNKLLPYVNSLVSIAS